MYNYPSPSEMTIKDIQKIDESEVSSLITHIGMHLDRILKQSNFRDTSDSLHCEALLREARNKMEVSKLGEET